jgi:hypothetical protein
MEYDFAVVTRYDLRLLTPITTWGCHNTSLHAKASEQRLCIASKMHPTKGSFTWKRHNATMDIFYVVPRAHLPGFVDSLGIAESPGARSLRCCFRSNCPLGAGHTCWNVFTKRIAGGSANVSFLWPFATPSAKRPSNGPDYQCCRMGSTNWTRVYDIETRRMAVRSPQQARLIPPSFGPPTYSDA